MKKNIIVLLKIKSIESKNARSRNYSLCLKKKNMLQKSPLNQNIVFSSNLELNNHLIRQFNFSNDEVHSLRNLKTSERTLNKIKETRNKQIHNNEETTKKKRKRRQSFPMLTRLVSNLWAQAIRMPKRWDYRCEPLCPALNS